MRLWCCMFLSRCRTPMVRLTCQGAAYVSPTPTTAAGSRQLERSPRRICILCSIQSRSDACAEGTRGAIATGAPSLLFPEAVWRLPTPDFAVLPLAPQREAAAA